LAKKHGIQNAVPIGFPKLDPAFDGAITDDVLNQYRKKLNLDIQKHTVIFATTWDKSGMSAIDRWIDRLPELKSIYNVLVTVHQWVNQKYKDKLEQMPGIFYINDKDILPYLMIADVMVCDMSSIIAEFCALDKPIVTFRVPDGKRPSHEVKAMLEEISIRVDTFDEMVAAINDSLLNPQKLLAQRQKYNRVMFDELDGKAGLRAASFIREKYLE